MVLERKKFLAMDFASMHNLKDDVKKAVEDLLIKFEIQLNREFTESREFIFVKHLEEHPEVIGAPVNPGIAMCKICKKTIYKIYEEYQEEKNKQQMTALFG